MAGQKKLSGIAFIGGGNMALALASGLIGKYCPASDLHIIDINEQTLTGWQQQGASVSTTPDNILSTKNVWFLSVKPQFIKEAIQSCKPYLNPKTLVISVAAGVSVQSLSVWLGSPEEPHERIVRCMPNTPALIGQGATGIYASGGVNQSNRDLANTLLSSVSKVTWVDTELQLDAVTALSGSGPAYVFLFLEALVQGGTELGLNPKQAKELAIATLQGATALAEQSEEDLHTLRDRVTSKGGTTAAALDTFMKNDFFGTVIKSMNSAYMRAAELSKELD